MGLSASAYHVGTCVGSSAPCDLLSQSGCAPEQGCALIAKLGIQGYSTACDAAGTTAVGQSCTTNGRACVPSSTCADGLCHRYCALGSLCDGGGLCRDLASYRDVPSDVIGVCVIGCGDGACEGDESCSSCPDDCGTCPSECGDTNCDADESCASCPDDCGPCASCGDGECNGEENCVDCPSDCDASTCFCGDGVCTDSESCESCPGDCEVCSCGDGTCSPVFGEDCGTCPNDCGVCSCGDGVCLPPEDCGTCPSDCPTCECGDGTCASNESCADCPNDCGSCECGNNVCDPGESCESCTSDCGSCECGDGTCQSTENCMFCPQDCQECSCGDGFCDLDEDCESCLSDCGSCNCGDGVCSPDESCSSCPADCNLLGVSACQGACQLDQAGGDCGANQACVPSAEGRLNMPALLLGSGVCGTPCSEDAECLSVGSDGCTVLEGLSSGGVCGVAASCDAAEPICFTSTLSACVATPGGDGACVKSCFPESPTDCSGSSSCITRSDPAWSGGVCVGQAVACNPALQTGCAEGQTCSLIAGLGIGGSSLSCREPEGEDEAGSPCVVYSRNCAVGLMCVADTCRQPCAPGSSTCPEGQSCQDISTSHGLSANTLGVCQ